MMAMAALGSMAKLFTTTVCCCPVATRLHCHESVGLEAIKAATIAATANKRNAIAVGEYVAARRRVEYVATSRVRDGESSTTKENEKYGRNS